MIRDAFPPRAQLPAMVACLGLYALLVWMLLFPERFVALVLAVLP